MVGTKLAEKISFRTMLFILLLCIGAWLRLYNLELNPGWYHDECVFVDQSWNLIHGRFQWEAVSNTFLPRLPLPHLVTGALMLFFGRNLLVIRAFYALCGMSIIVMLYFVNPVTGSKNHGLLYAMVYTIMPYTVLYNRWGFTYNLITVLSLGVFLFVLRYLKDGKSKWLWIAASLAGLASVSEIIAFTNFLFVGIILLFVRRKQNLIIFFTAFIPLFLYVSLMFLLQRDIFLQDIMVVFQKRAVESGFLSGFLKFIWQLPKQFQGFLRFQGYWTLFGFSGIFLVSDRQTRYLAILATLFVSYAILLTSADDTSLLYREAIMVTPYWAMGVGTIIGKGFTFLRNLIKEDLPTLLPSIKEMPRDIAATLAPGCIIIAIMVPVFFHQATQVVHGFSTPLDWLCVQHPEAAFEMARFINARVSPEDVVLESHVGWLFKCRSASLMQSAVQMGGKDHPFFPEGVFHDRFLFDCHYRKAKYVVIHPFAYNYCSQFEKVDEIIVNVEKWPIVAVFKDLVVYQNPGVEYQPLTGAELMTALTGVKIRRFEQQIARGDEDPGTFNNLGTAYAMTGEYEKAEFYYQQAITRNQSYALAQYNLANLYYEAFHNSEKAIKHFEIFLLLAPEDPRSSKARDILSTLRYEN